MPTVYVPNDIPVIQPDPISPESKEDVARLMKQFARLTKEGKYEEAYWVAMRAQTFAPEDPAVDAMVELSLNNLILDANESVPSKDIPAPTGPIPPPNAAPQPDPRNSVNPPTSVVQLPLFKSEAPRNVAGEESNKTPLPLGPDANSSFSGSVENLFAAQAHPLPQTAPVIQSNPSAPCLPPSLPDPAALFNLYRLLPGTCPEISFVCDGDPQPTYPRAPQHYFYLWCAQAAETQPVTLASLTPPQPKEPTAPFMIGASIGSASRDAIHAVPARSFYLSSSSACLDADASAAAIASCILATRSASAHSASCGWAASRHQRFAGQPSCHRRRQQSTCRRDSRRRFRRAPAWKRRPHTHSAHQPASASYEGSHRRAERCFGIRDRERAGRTRQGAHPNFRRAGESRQPSVTLFWCKKTARSSCLKSNPSKSRR